MAEGIERRIRERILIDETAIGLVAEFGGCLREIEINGNYFGRFGMTAALIGADLEEVRRAAAECTKALTAFDAQVIEERCNLLNASRQDPHAAGRLRLPQAAGNENTRRVHLPDRYYAFFRDHLHPALKCAFVMC